MQSFGLQWPSVSFKCIFKALWKTFLWGFEFRQSPLIIVKERCGNFLLFGIREAPGRAAVRLQGLFSFVLAVFLVFWLVCLWVPMAQWCKICGIEQNGKVEGWGCGADREIDFGFACGCIACVRAKLLAGVRDNGSLGVMPKNWKFPGVLACPARPL